MGLTMWEVRIASVVFLATTVATIYARLQPVPVGGFGCHNPTQPPVPCTVAGSARLALIRHGESQANVGGGKWIFETIPDPDLTERGARQAVSSRSVLNSLSVDVVFASSLRRAMTTGTLASAELDNARVYVAPFAAELDSIAYTVFGQRKCDGRVQSVCPLPRAEQRASIARRYGPEVERRIDWSLVGGPNASNEALKLPNDFISFSRWMWAQRPVQEATTRAAQRGQAPTIALFTHGNLLEGALPCGWSHARNVEIYTSRISRCDGSYPVEPQVLWWPNDSSPELCHGEHDVLAAHAQSRGRPPCERDGDLLVGFLRMRQYLLALLASPVLTCLHLLSLVLSC